jgi:hypothetical protein
MAGVEPETAGVAGVALGGVDPAPVVPAPVVPALGSDTEPVVSPWSPGAAWHALELASSWTFDQITELLENARLVASSNS